MQDLPPLVRITAVAVVGEHELRLTFEDGTVGDVTFDDSEWRGVLEPLRDPAQFAQVFVDEPFGTIAWPNGLDMAPEPLYEQAQTPRRRPSDRAPLSALAPGPRQRHAIADQRASRSKLL